MKTIAKVLVPLLALASLAGMTIEILNLMEIGTCASGGPYVSARECPDGTGTTILILGGCITVYTFAIIGMSFSDFAAGAFWFGLLFVVLGGAFLYSEISGSSNGGGGVGYIIGPLFLLMGIFPAIFGAKEMIAGIGEEDPVVPAFASGFRPATGAGSMLAGTGLTGNVATGAGIVPPAPGTPPPAPKKPAANPPSATEFVAKVKELDELRQQGVLTQTEFEVAKAKLLKGE